MATDLTKVKELFGKYEAAFKKQQDIDPYDDDNLLNFLLYSFTSMVFENNQKVAGLKNAVDNLDDLYRKLTADYNKILSKLNSKEGKQFFGD